MPALSSRFILLSPLPVWRLFPWWRKAMGRKPEPATALLFEWAFSMEKGRKKEQIGAGLGPWLPT